MEEDNAADRAEQRAILLNQSSRGPVSRAGATPVSSAISLRTAFYGLLVGAALLFIIMAVVIVTKQGGNVAGFYAPGSDCSVVTCPAGPAGVKGDTGGVGPPGPATIGPSGPSGPSGPIGPPGNTGSPGMCLGNSACERGLTGDTGATGAKGSKGSDGDIGPPGDTGERGPQGVQGVTGAKGDKGNTGAGIQGIQGTPGVCNCSSTLPLSTFVGLNVTGAPGITTTLLNVTSEMICSNGATLGKECFGLTGACPNFSPCWLNMTAISINEGGNVGINISTYDFHTVSTLGAGMRVSFGDSSALNDVVSDWEVYSSNVEITCIDFCQITSTASPLSLITTNSSNINLLSDGSMSGLAQGTIIFQSTSNGVQLVGGNGDSTWNVGNPQGTLLGTADILFDIRVPNFVFQSNVGTPNVYQWLYTNNTYRISTSPGTQNITFPVASNQPGTLFVNSDVAFINEVNLIGFADGYIGVSGLKSARNNGQILTLQKNTSSDILDIRASIQNLDPTLLPVTFEQTLGVDFKGTPIFNSILGPVVGPLLCNDVDGFQISSGSLILGAAGGPQATFTMSGTAGAAILTITPSTSPALTLVGPPTNAISDARVKRNITTIPPEEDLQFVLSLPRRVSYQRDKTIDADNTTIRNGYIAQELEKVAPNMVHSGPYTLRDGKTVIRDFRTVDLSELVPRLAGALEALYERNLLLEKRIEELERLR